ncbi:MAG: ribonuclease P protein component [Candidatus Magasanikbacteria bacterium]|jgi:ribonuclease P protein component|nr:ribonuclease P protein component [Candidatus Magasanikbacteria bacterium]
MLPDQYRLKRDRDFEILFKEGQFVSGTLLTMKVWKIDPIKYPKRGYKTDDLLLGFVVSTKISKNAVVRNRLKRQMREVIRLLIKENRIKNGFMVGFLAKAEMIGKAYEEIETSMMEILRRASLLKSSS